MALQCPLPENINLLSPNGFMFSIEKLPELTYFCQLASLPDINLPYFRQATPLSDPAVAGDSLQFADITVNFLVDENMSNWEGIFNWMQALGFPEKWTQYSDFINNNTKPLSELQKNYSDGVLSVLGSNNVPVKTFRFVDMIPTNLNTLEFSSTNEGVQYLTGQATFAYSYYKIE